MYRSYNEEKFHKAVAEKNYLYAKTCVTSAIKANPQFSPMKGEGNRSEARVAYDYIKQHLPEAFAPYKLYAGELVITDDNLAEATEDLFYEKCFHLEENFCAQRYNELRRIGKYLVDIGTFPMPQEQTTAESNAPITTQESRKKMPLPVKIALIAAAVLLVALVAKMMAWDWIQKLQDTKN